MRKVCLLTSFLLTLTTTSASSATSENSIIQVQQVLMSTLSVNSNMPFIVTITANLQSTRPLSAFDRNTTPMSGTLGVGCVHNGAFDSTAQITLTSKDSYIFSCQIVSTELSKTLSTGIQEVDIQTSEITNSAIVPFSKLTYPSSTIDSFGTKSTTIFPASLLPTKMVGNERTMHLAWAIGLAINPPSSYIFPSYPKVGDAFQVFKSNESSQKTTYTLDKKRQRINVKCALSVPTFSLGSAKAVTTTKLLIGEFPVGGPSWNYNYPKVPGKTLNVLCITQTVLANHANQIIGYNESTPVPVSFPKI